MVNREFYLNQIIRHMHNGDIKVITIELDQWKSYKFRNPITLCEYVEAIVSTDKGKQFYPFIDEVQFTKTVKDTENDEIEVSIYDIYNDLIRRGYSVDVGVVVDRRHGGFVQKEVDFVDNHGDRKLYIQSAFQMGTDQKESAELDALKLTGDFFKKIIVWMDIPHNFYDDNGIFHCNLIDFLLERVELF